MASNTGRRNFIRKTAALTGGAFAAGGAARAAPLPVPPSKREPGRVIEETAYGMPSKFEAHVKRRRTDVLKNRQNLSDWSMTPLQHQPGIITPNGLIFERHHAGTPDIDPKTHRLVIHGMVKQPLEFSMEDLRRYPSVSRFHFHECSGNGLTDWLKPASTTVQQTHGLLSGVLWTGVPASTLLEEAGIDPRGKWVLFEGADASAHARSIPIEKMLDDTIIVYAMNGEALRPENGYPVRVVPARLGRQHQREVAAAHQGRRPAVALAQRDRALYRPDARRQVAPVQHGDGMPSPSSPRPRADRSSRGPASTKSRDSHGRARARSARSTSPFDGGKNWREADARGADHGQVPDALQDRLELGRLARGADEPRGRQQRLRAADGAGPAKKRAIVGFVQHHNAIQPWAVNAQGEVRNVIGQA